MLEALPQNFELANLHIPCDTSSLILTAMPMFKDVPDSNKHAVICELDDAQWLISSILCCEVPVRFADMDMENTHLRHTPSTPRI